MKRSSLFQRIILPAVIVAVGLITVALLSGFIKDVRPSLPDGYEDSELTFNGSRIKGFAFGMEGLAADWYYVRALQYVGYKIINSKSDFINIEDLRDLNPVLLYPLLSTTTDLDPHFITAYTYGALVLPAIDPEKAIALATKGIENNPNEWRLYQYLGYIYWRLERYDKASEIFERGSEIAGAAPFMKIMAASMKNEGGSRETARTIYREMLNGTTDEQVQITARRKLEQLDSLDERELIDKALADLKEKSGNCANSLHEILPMLAKLKLPEGRDFRLDKANDLVDPTGAPYVLNKQTCRAELDPEKTGIAIR